eukprot:1988816-Pyramimonas_sp.AAC.1
MPAVCMPTSAMSVDIISYRAPHGHEAASVYVRLLAQMLGIGDSMGLQATGCSQVAIGRIVQ